MNLNDAKKIHFIGIGGIGVSAIAKMMLARGKEVSGSDAVQSEITRELVKSGARVFIGHKKGNLPPGTDLVIYSPAVPETNGERQEARGRRVVQMSYPDVLGQISRGKFTVAVSGTNGKTTTTAMLGLILAKAGLDPLVVVGSKVREFGGNLRLPTGKAKARREYFVVEACEHQAHMLKLSPKAIVLTNIEEDHLDYYRDLAHIKETFQKYISRLPKEGFLAFNADDKNNCQLKMPKCRAISFGIKGKADLTAKNIRVVNGRQEFEVTGGGKSLGKFYLQVPGKFNVYNALAAVSAALELGVSPEIIRDALGDFKGTWRRFEITGNVKFKGKGDAIVVSDYAHHPTAIKGTIRAAREFYPDRRLVALFQPHQHNRTKKLFKGFAGAFDEADLVVLSEIFDVTGREEEKDKDVSSKKLSAAVRARKKEGKKVRFGKVLCGRDLKETEKLVLQNLRPNDLLLIMGAGDIYKLNSKFK